MKNTKRFFAFLVTISMLATLTACGGHGEAVPAPVEQETKDFAGEGQVQGGIKSDEEIAALQEEEEQYASEKPATEEPAAEEPTVEYAENVSNEGHIPDTYIGTENFWQGDNYFDLENYLYMNGASSVEKGYYDDSWSFQESADKITVYKAHFENPYWYVTIQLPVSIEFRYDGYLLDGVPVLHPVYLATQSTPVEDQKEITVNDIGSTMTDTAIQTLDKMISLTKDYPDDDNPFQYNDRTDLFGVGVSSEDIPAGATKR